MTSAGVVDELVDDVDRTRQLGVVEPTDVGARPHRPHLLRRLLGALLGLGPGHDRNASHPPSPRLAVRVAISLPLRLAGKQPVLRDYRSAGEDMTAVLPPALPTGRFVDLPGRGRTWVRELGPPDAPTLLLLHGWSVTADLNWWTAYQALAADHHVVALDHRGHSDGIRDGRRFTLEDCADDAAALCDALGVHHVVPVGYSMGGAVAQLLWQRHRGLVDGLVLCATSRSFRGRPKDHTLLGLLNAAAPGARRLTPEQRALVAIRLLNGRRADEALRERAAEALRRHDWLRVLEAGQAVFRFDSRPWAHHIDVPVGVVVTSHDRVVPTPRQLQLATALPGATVHVVDGDHGACAAEPGTFLPQLLNACRSVVDRIATSTAVAAVRTASA